MIFYSEYFEYFHFKKCKMFVIFKKKFNFPKTLSQLILIHFYWKINNDRQIALNYNFLILLKVESGFKL